MQKIKNYQIKKNLPWIVVFLSVIVLDQLTKALVVKFLDEHTSANIIGDFLIFMHVRNLFAGFGIGHNFPQFVRYIVLYALPVVLVCALIYLFINADRYKIETRIEKLSLSLIIAGGTGNLIDRFFRPKGVVDFISVKVYGFLGFDYWPTFNIADSSVVVGVILLFVYTLIINPILVNKSRTSKK